MPQDYGLVLFQSKRSSDVEYLSPLLQTLRANARDVLRTLGREDALDEVEFFTNRRYENDQGEHWGIGWKVSV